MNETEQKIAPAAALTIDERLLRVEIELELIKRFLEPFMSGQTVEIAAGCADPSTLT